jgi:hypothetical protein
MESSEAKLTAAEKVEAMRAKSWMQRFLSVALSPSAELSRAKVEFFGGEDRATKGFEDCHSILVRVGFVKSHSAEDDTTRYWRLKNAAELGEWFVETVTQNRAERFEALAAALRGRENRPVRKSLKALILKHLEDHIAVPSSATGPFGYRCRTTAYYFSLMEHSEDEETTERMLATWWKDPFGRWLRPGDLPTKNKLQKAAEPDHCGDWVSQDFPREYRRARDEMGLGGLPKRKGEWNPG